MNQPPTATPPNGERRLMRTGLFVAGTLLAVGLLLSMLGFDGQAHWPLMAGLFTLMTLPVLNVVVILRNEIRQGDWRFVAVTSGVLAILIYNITRLR